jgi:signal transduction histidine kinase
MPWYSVRNWSKYSRLYADDKGALYKHKRVILLSQFTLAGFIIGVVHSLEDLVDGLIFMPMMDLTMAIVIFGCYLLNEKGFTRAAKLTLLSFLNIFFFIYSSLADRELGIFLYYFPWIALAAVIFEKHEWKERIFFISLSTILLITLFATRFDAFGNSHFEAVAIGKSYVINLVSSILVLVFFVIFMVRMNDDSEKRLMDTAEELNQNNVRLEKMNRELDRFMYSASHDLRSPLMSIKGLTDIIRLESKDENTTRYMDMMDERIDKLDSFICDIIDYSRNAKTEIKLEKIDFPKLLFEVVSNFDYMEGAEHTTLLQDIRVNNVPLDKSRMTVVMNNLISNAIKYRDDSQAQSWIKVSTALVEKCVVITVSDNGQGIAEKHLDKIFDMFYRATNKSKGSGLGLYIVKEAIEKMNGTIEVKSAHYKGTEFIITFPFTEGDVV